MTNLITTDEYTLYVGESLSGYDVLGIAALLEVLSGDVSTFCGRSFWPTHFVNQRIRAGLDNVHTELVVRLNAAPLICCESLNHMIMGSSINVDLSLSDIDEVNAIIRTPYFLGLMQQSLDIIVRATFWAGYQQPPTAVKMATAFLLKEALDALAKVREGGQHAPLSSFRLGNYAETYQTLKNTSFSNAADQLGLGTTMSALAIQRLMRYKRVGIVML